MIRVPFYGLRATRRPLWPGSRSGLLSGQAGDVFLWTNYLDRELPTRAIVAYVYDLVIRPTWSGTTRRYLCHCHSVHGYSLTSCEAADRAWSECWLGVSRGVPLLSLPPGVPVEQVAIGAHEATAHEHMRQLRQYIAHWIERSATAPHPAPGVQATFDYYRQLPVEDRVHSFGSPVFL